MIEIFLTDEAGITGRVDEPAPGCWVSVVDPTPEDRNFMVDDLGIVPEFVSAALDDEERAHTDYDDDMHQTLIIVDCPFVEDKQEAEDDSITQYDTHPLSFLLLPDKDMVVTVSLRENATIQRYSGPRLRTINTHQRTRLFLLMQLHIAHGYITYLRNIDRQFNANEKVLRESLRSNDLIKMLGFEKSLVYFSTSLKSHESLLNRIDGGRILRLYEDDRDLLDDVIIEIKQAVEMCSIYTSILNGTMESFGNVINNNMNRTIRTLTIITLVFAIPTIIFSFYGMNTDVLPLSCHWLWPTGFSAVGMIVAIIIFTRLKSFK